MGPTSILVSTDKCSIIDTMCTRGNKHPNATRLTPQQREDLLLKVINQLGSLNKKVDVVWNHVFDKPKGSSANKQEDTLEKLHLDGKGHSED